MRFWSLLLTTAVLIAAPPVGQAADASVAEVTRLRGAAFVHGAGDFRALAEGRPVYAGDRIVTGSASRLELIFDDGSVVTLGERTELVIERFDYDKQEPGGEALWQLGRGALRTLTGAIVHGAEPRFRILTPAATVGLEGSDLWCGLRASQALDVLLISGTRGLWVESDGGRVELRAAGVGTTVPNRTLAPKTPQRWHGSQVDAAKASVSWD
jgi:hypothetical protein